MEVEKWFNPHLLVHLYAYDLHLSLNLNSEEAVAKMFKSSGSARKKSNKIDKQLRKEKKIYVTTYRLLVLGKYAFSFLIQNSFKGVGVVRHPARWLTLSTVDRLVNL